LNQEDIDRYVPENHQRQVIAENLSDEDFYTLERNNSLEDYLFNAIPPGEITHKLKTDCG